MGLDGVCGVLTRGKCRVFTKNWPKKKKANKRASDDQHLGGPSRLPANEANCPADFCRQVGSRVRGMLSKWFQSCLFRTCMRRLGESTSWGTSLGGLSQSHAAITLPGTTGLLAHTPYYYLLCDSPSLDGHQGELSKVAWQWAVNADKRGETG